MLKQPNLFNYSAPSSSVQNVLGTLGSSCVYELLLSPGTVTKSWIFLLCRFFLFISMLKKAAAWMWQIVVSIIKMTLQFLWEQLLHMVTATPCHSKVVHMNHQLHMETLLQMTKLTHLILLTQGRAQGKSIPTIRWRKGPYRDYNKSFKSTLRHSTGVSQGSLYGLQAQTSDTWMPRGPLWWCSWNCWGAHFCSVRQTGDREEPVLCSPEQKAKFAWHKNRQQQDTLLYTLVPTVFSKRISTCLKGISSIYTNPCSQA